MKKIKLFIIFIVSLMAGYMLAKLPSSNNYFFSSHSKSLMVSEKKEGIKKKISDKEKSELQQAISKIIPGTQIEELSFSPLPGIYQVVANNEVLYVSQDGRYLLSGDLFDLTKQSSQLNQTEETRKHIRLKAISTINEEEMIIFRPQKPQGVVTVFTDIDCVFCQRLHKDIQKIMDLGIEVRYLAFPRQGIDSDGYHKAVSVWCADDAKAMLTMAKNGEAIPSRICNTPIAKNAVIKQYELGHKLNIQGTPTLLFADGTMLARYMMPEELQKFVFEHKAEVK